MHIWRSVQQILNDVLGWYHPNNRGNATIQQNCQNSLAQTYQSYLHTVMMTYKWKICLLQSLIVFTTGTIEHSYFSVHWVDVCVYVYFHPSLWLHLSGANIPRDGSTILCWRRLFPLPSPSSLPYYEAPNLSNYPLYAVHTIEAGKATT